MRQQSKFFKLVSAMKTRKLTDHEILEAKQPMWRFMTLSSQVDLKKRYLIDNEIIT